MNATIDALERPAVQAPQAAKRLPWLDIARGMGIALVAIGHALGGTIDSPAGKGAPFIREAFFSIYTFHMPLFFILSGLMVQRRVGAAPRDFGKSMLIDLVWPYFLWSVIQFTVIYALGSLVNKEIERYWPTVIGMPWRPVSQFWFLYALFLLHLFALTCLPRLRPAGFLLVCLALKPAASILALPVVIRLAAISAPWYGFGVFLAAPGLYDLVVTHSKTIRGFIAPALAAALIVMTLIASPKYAPDMAMSAASAAQIAGVAWNMAAFPAGLCGALAIVGLATLVSGRAGVVFALLGRRSMPILILHIMGIAGTRIIVTKLLHVTAIFPTITLSVVVGLVWPLVAFSVAARLGWTRALGWGRP